MTSNPSVVLHISHQYCSVGQGCTKPIHLYESYSTSRCADQEVSVNVIEAQDCSTASTTPAEDTSKSRDSCHYHFVTQPGSTTETCHLTGTRFLVLRCQVSSDRNNNFSINWRYSHSQPAINNVASATYIDDSITALHSNITMTSISSNSTELSLMSQLKLSGFDEKGDGYFWCSVNSSSDTHTMTSNPSVMLHISHQYCSVDQSCTKPINLYESYSTPRCADQEVSVNIIEAQDCTASATPAEETSKSTDTDLPTTTMALKTTAEHTLALQTTGQQTTDLHTMVLQTTSQHATTTVTSVAPSLSLGVETVIGVSMGGLILILCFIIGLLVVYIMKMKLKHRTREHRTDPTSPFNDIVMYSSVKMLENEKVDDTNGISKTFCEPNISYEYPHIATSESTDNIYDYIR